MKFKNYEVKLIRSLSLIVAGVSLSGMLYSQTTANGSVPVSKVSAPVINSSPAAENKSAPAALSNNKVKVVDKKNRKPAHVTTVKRPIQNLKK